MLDFIEAVDLLRQWGLACEATVSGIGPDVDAARALAAERSLTPYELRFTGGVDYSATPCVYAQADIFASPTYAEGFSNTILEAIAAGLPVASCAVVGVTDCLRHDDNSLLTEAGDVPAHAAALRRLIEDATLRHRIAARALQDCRANYSWRIVGRRIVGIYEELRGSEPAAGFARDLVTRPCRFPRSAASALTMTTALAISPHLDDAVFSAGGILARLSREGWRVVIATVFTASVPDPKGFALACQLDKGLLEHIDYMALRRSEDAAACATIGAEPHWLPFAEAPHRGYSSAAELFGPPRDDDQIVDVIAPALAELIDTLAPDEIFSPQAIGAHVDHVAVYRALASYSGPRRLWADFPYTIRPAPRPSPFAAEIVRHVTEHIKLAPDEVRLKTEAAKHYESQLGFQFGGREAARAIIETSGRIEMYAWSDCPVQKLRWFAE